MSGSHPLPSPFSKFYAFPCLNPPTLNFQFGGALFPAMHGGRGADWSHIPGSRFSLGRLESGSGYCVGSVVETSMGVREKLDELTGDSQDELHTATRRGGMAGNGMRDVWVIGEGFFRGVGGVFDVRFPLLSLFTTGKQHQHTTYTDQPESIAQRATGRVSLILRLQQSTVATSRQ